MISEFLLKCFIKNYKEVSDKKVRNAYGFLASIVGMLSNTLLFLIKLFVGILSNSVSVTADAFNNLSDFASSLITMIGFKMASKPADKEHPFGHGRIEYLSALVVAFMVMLVGFQFIKTSYDRIVHPTKIVFQTIPFLLIILSILIKIWLGKFNNYMGKSINSSALQASSFDAYSDVITSSCVAISLVISKFTNIPIDGYIGILVSLFILYSGFSLIKDTLDPILGESPNPELVKEINKGVLNYDYITGVHDLVIHNYGPGKFMATIHAEVPQDISIVTIHEIIDKAEKELSKKLGIILVIHMDPINTDNKEVNFTKQELIKMLKKYPYIKSIHDFRMVGHDTKKNLIFDIVIDYSEKLTNEFIKEVKDNINKDIKTLHPDYNAIITIDQDFS